MTIMSFSLNVILSRPLPRLLVIAALAAPYVINLGVSSIWDANEAFYAETPREMIESGNYLAPQFNYQPRPQKPPLTYWLVLAFYKIVGISEFAARLPGALAAIGTLIFTYLIGRTLFSPVAGVLAAAILGTTIRFYILARRLPIDILLLFWLTGAAYFLVRSLQRSSPSWKTWAPLFLFLGFGFLTKGPVAWIIPAATCLIWAVCARHRFSFAPLRIWAGMLILAAIVFPWYLLIYNSRGWDYIASFFLKDNLARFAGDTMGPARGPHFYVLAYLADFFPWSILSLSAGASLWSLRRNLNPERVLSVGIPAIWSGFVLVLFSLSGNKQEYYIAPLYPLMSVLLAGLLWSSSSLQEEHQKKETNYPWMWSFTAIFLALFALSIIVLLLSRSLLPELPQVLHYLPFAVLMIAAFALVWQIIRADLDRCILSVAAPLWLLFLLISWIFLPAVEPFRPVKEMCAEIEMRSDAADEAGYYLATVPSMVYYLRRPVFEEFDPDAMVKKFQSNKTVFCILTEQDYNYFVGRRDLILYVLDRRARLITQLRYLLDEDSWPARELLLVSNRPAPETGAREGRTTP